MAAGGFLLWPGQNRNLPLEKIKLPPGFSITVYSDQVPGARSLAIGEKGTVFAGTRPEGKVYAIQAGKVTSIASGLNEPNGVAFYRGDLYVAEISRILKFKDIENRLNDPPAPEIVYAKYPTDNWHGWKFIKFGPDGRLYVPVGAPCNVCEPPAPVYAGITRLNPDGTGFEIFARGIRNTVGFDWHPRTKELWFTDNGRDWLGDNVPPDELNRAPKTGLHFGFPYYHGSGLPDPAFGKKFPKNNFVPPVRDLGPHVAALGMRFYTGKMFPEKYQNQIFIAEHGSWNRADPLGYRVTLVTLQGDRAVSYETFAEGWLQGKSSWGRPVDVQVMPDGTLLVSDDKAGAIYRISYKP
ncbi:MAG: PQQ-dependent sugar dehydrogenase [bacterium]|nr:PQQ-dependent sugar dehydrogenase [bacterium]MDD5354554.1 PQQ-dependent sugar dehydrogenase [bacterium]MDD5756078.1 PQQ-dependent sugar dehydrogenase [bacterium]